MSDTVIKVENLFKEYRLGTVSHGTLRHDLASWWAKARGKDDPNSLLTTTHPRTPSLEREGAKKDEEELKQHFLALNDVSFEVKAGEAVGIIGRNGAGKSTLLKILSRITAPSSGTIKIKGKMSSLLEVGTGFHPEMTGRENVYMNGAILGMRRYEIGRKMDEIVAFAELEKFIDTPVKRYSSGMYVRLAFAVAAHLDSDILILDEVLAVGDAQFQKKCLGKMDDVAHRQGRAVLFVSHNMGAVEQLCNCGVFLENGKATLVDQNIQKVIDRYKSGGYKNKGSERSVVWENNQNRYLNMYFVPEKICLVDDNDQIIKSSTIRNTDGVYFLVQGNCLEYDPALAIGYRVYNSENVLLYETYMFDLESTFWPKIVKGKNILKTKLPSRFFNEGEYRIELMLFLHNKQWILEPSTHDVEIFFGISGGLSDSPYWTERRPGVLAPVFEWKLK